MDARFIFYRSQRCLGNRLPQIYRYIFFSIALLPIFVRSNAEYTNGNSENMENQSDIMNEVVIGIFVVFGIILVVVFIIVLVVCCRNQCNGESVNANERLTGYSNPNIPIEDTSDHPPSYDIVMKEFDKLPRYSSLYREHKEPLPLVHSLREHSKSTSPSEVYDVSQSYRPQDGRRTNLVITNDGIDFQV